MATHFRTNPFGALQLVYITALMAITASYVVGTHSRKTYYNREFNRFEPKKFHSYHHYDGHLKQDYNNGHPSFTINTMHETQGYDKMDRLNSMHPSQLQGKLPYFINTI